ncbi:MAG: DUF2202 domain-containing protein [Lewinellaceae bacterium]|nr:DUF2202 domain-containing protein [Saprospiraceae bacterium]MCB9338482.1 DUF2202 domain-containing protein [Lewinellaceae bacterium]
MLALVFGAVLLLANCKKDDNFVQKDVLTVNTTDGYTDVNFVNCQYNLDNLPTETLSEAEKSSILFMREEEKLAMDIYMTLHDKWSTAHAFHNISQSEMTHTDAMLQLIVKYNLTDPVGTNGTGVFVNTTLQTMYDDLVLQGETSLIEALKVGALVEEVDILDLKNALNTFVDNQDVEMVYENLMAASRNHLRAFVKNLTNQGVTYVPQKLTQAEYDEIINGDWEHGHHGG